MIHLLWIQSAFQLRTRKPMRENTGNLLPVHLLSVSSKDPCEVSTEEERVHGGEMLNLDSWQTEPRRYYSLIRAKRIIASVYRTLSSPMSLKKLPGTASC